MTTFTEGARIKIAGYKQHFVVGSARKDSKGGESYGLLGARGGQHYLIRRPSGRWDFLHCYTRTIYNVEACKA